MLNLAFVCTVKKISIYALLPLLFAAFAFANPFAESPPEVESVKKLFAKKVNLEPSVEGKPLPTNDWWTSLLANPSFPGRLYAYPFTVSADAAAVKIWYPRDWNENGTEMVAGEPLLIEPIDLSPNPNPTEKVLFDFESDWDSMGWVMEGSAFGKSPMKNAQHASRNFVGLQFAASFYGHDGATGVATSPKFAIAKDYLHFKVAGGKDKKVVGVHLLIDGQSVLQENGDNNNDYSWRKWDLRKYKGKQGQVRLRDESKGGWGFVGADHFVLSDSEEVPKSGPFSHASTMKWGDWHIAMRLHLSDAKKADVTFGRGMPYVWIEPKGIDLKIPGLVKANGTLVHQGRTFGIHAPGGTLEPRGQFTQFSGPVLAISALDEQLTGLQKFVQHAAAVPRDTLFDWRYDAANGRVNTLWQIKTANGGAALQGWIPHHYRKTRHDLKSIGVQYTTRRGKMVVAEGNRFLISWPFSGIIPAFPLPKDDGFKPAVLSDQIEKWGRELLKKPAEDRQGKDTYWGGKSMLKTAQAMTMAKQLNHPLADDLLAEAKRITADWLTYKPGEKFFYYARYPAPWNGLVGFNSSYGSEQFTDNHFHYGYLAMSAALIGIQDAAWLKQHGPAAREVVKQYAEWERDSKSYPRLRTFECWAGHSYAGGMSSGYDGNNQESSSEAVGSWAGTFFLGAVLGDAKMMGTGAMGYAIETEAVHEYWNNAYGWKNPAQSNWSNNYKPTICSVMRDRDMGAWTWFSGEPIHIYGIQWLPAWTHMNYFGAHKEHSVFQLDQMLIRQGKEKGKLSWQDIDGDWGQVAAAYAAFCQPVEICKILDQAIAGNWKISHHKHAGIPYYLAHASRVYGFVDPESHADLPTSVVLKRPDGKRTVLVYNISNQDQVVTVYVKGKPVMRGSLAPKRLSAVPLKSE